MSPDRSALYIRIALIPFMLGCAEQKQVGVRFSQVMLPSGRLLSTSDPSAKNWALRQDGAKYEGMLPGYRVPVDRVSRLRKARLGDLAVLSMDEGIVVHRPRLADSAPAVLRRSPGYDLYWSSSVDGDTAVLRAGSGDGYLWSSPEMVLGPSARSSEEAGDAASTTDPSLLVVDGTWYLYYTGSSAADADHEVFCARSTDGKTWEKYSASGDPDRPTPVLPNARRDGTYGIGKSSLCYRNGLFYHWYTDKRRGAGGLWLAVSEDGITFRNHRQVASHVENADVKYCPALEIFLMVWGSESDDKIFLNVSPDGVTWLPREEEAELAVGPPETTHHSPCFVGDGLGNVKSQTRVFYSGGVSLPGSLEENSWEIEATWVQFRKAHEQGR